MCCYNNDKYVLLVNIHIFASMLSQEITSTYIKFIGAK